jgi:hypothetical protein
MSRLVTNKGVVPVSVVFFGIYFVILTGSESREILIRGRQKAQSRTIALVCLPSVIIFPSNSHIARFLLKSRHS